MAARFASKITAKLLVPLLYGKVTAAWCSMVWSRVVILVVFTRKCQIPGILGQIPGILDQKFDQIPQVSREIYWVWLSSW